MTYTMAAGTATAGDAFTGTYDGAGWVFVATTIEPEFVPK
jgi:hypothetical protein